MADAIKNFGINLEKSNGDAYVPFSLAPGAVSSFNMRFMLTDNGPLTATVSAVAMGGSVFKSGTDVNKDQATVSTTYVFTPTGYNLTDLREINFAMTATGANTFVVTEHVNTFTLSAMTPGLSSNGVEISSYDFTTNPMVCSFNIIFSTANIAPTPITSFTAVASGNQAVGLTWVNPTGTGLSAIKVVYKMNAIPATISDGTVVKLASSETSKFIDGLTAENREYYGFGIYAIDIDQQASTQVATSAYPVWQPGSRVWTSHAEFTRKRLLGYI